MDDAGGLRVGVDTGEPSAECSGVTSGCGLRRPTPTSDFNLFSADESDTADSGVGGVDIIREGGVDGALALGARPATVTGLFTGSRVSRSIISSTGSIWTR